MNQVFIIIGIFSAGLFGRPSPEIPTEPVPLTYQDILPIIKKNCAMCHNSSVPERNWLDYKTAFKKRESIKKRLQDKTMPIGVVMLESDRQLMIDWVNMGARK
jgi:hypothetical protein